MIELGIDFNDFFVENKKLINAEKTIFKLYEALDLPKKDLICSELYSALFSILRVLWVKFTLYATEKGAFASCDDSQSREVMNALRDKFEFHFPRPTPYFGNPEFRKAFKRKRRKQGDQSE